MGAHRWTLVVVLVMYSGLSGIAGYDGDEYYNNRYSDDGIEYTEDDAENGLWDSQYNYLHRLETGPPSAGGCSYDDTTDTITACTGSTVSLIKLDFANITAGTFAEHTTSLIIKECSSFELFEERTFENLTQLVTIIIQRTSLNHLPDLSNTAVTTVNLAGNKISMDTFNHRGWQFPTSIERLTLADNEIYWIPKKMISGPNLRIASFSNNKIFQIQPSIFDDTSALVYLGMDGNNISRISINSIAPLATQTFLHLNLSNNQMSFIQPNTFSSLPAIKIIEMHSNDMAKITWNVFSNMPNLVHLDLHGNELEALTSKSFVNLPSLKELRLHSQKTPMTTIAYDAWSGINDSLVELFVSDNALTHYPHPVLDNANYTKLITMHADNNLITNLTEFAENAFPASQRFLHAQRLAVFVPFSATPAVQVMRLGHNLITTINTTDLCELRVLQELYLQNNLIRESNMDPDCLACLPELYFLQMDGNLIQYIPPALRSSDVVPALRELWLDNNKITFLTTQAFTNVTTLLELHLSSNLILVVEDGAFPEQIEQIYMSGNSYRFVHELPFSNLSSLVTLDLSTNQIQYLPDDAFTNCTSLDNLYLGSNNIAQLKKVHLENCPLSGNAQFHSNDIGWIEDGTFAHITQISSLTLGDNKLTTVPNGGDFTNLTITGGSGFSLANNRINVIPSHAFVGLDVTYAFSLANNQITAILPWAFDGIDARDLSFAGNPIRYIYPYSFNNIAVDYDFTMSLSSFETIPTRAFNDISVNEDFHLESGIITTIEEDAFYNVNVENLHLQDNPLTSIPNIIFGGSSTVSGNFYLYTNNMTYISASAFDNVAIQDLYLNDNLFKAVPQVVAGQSFRELYLQDNLIEEIPTGFLDAQMSLIYLNLANNYLTALEPSVFNQLTSLQKLYLSNNQLLTPQSTQFQTMTSLQELYMGDNHITHVHNLDSLPLKIVDFSNNDIATIAGSAFSGLAQLQTLSLGENPLECSCQLVETMADVPEGVISSGACSQIAAASGYQFHTSIAANFYTKANTTWFLCSADSVGSRDVTGTGFTVTWSQPDYPYFQTNSTVDPPPLTGSVDYTIICTSSAGVTIETTMTDDNATVGATSLSVDLDATDGVLPGTPYECAVKMAVNGGQNSAKSEPAVFITLGDSTSNIVAGPDDIELHVTYYDFSKSHDDFNNVHYPSVTGVTYMDSPYGAWLAASDTPLDDTFSSWYREDTDTIKVESTIVLLAQSGNAKKRFYTDAFFPVDGLGFESESQLDCNGTYHNFGFTSSARVGLVYGGSEVITVGGGEAMWLYINKVNMLQFVSDGTNTTMYSCYVLDLSTASGPDGVVNVQSGFISDGSCTDLVTSTSTISLSLEIGITYHFDWFHAETKRCTSELLFEVENVVLSQDKTVDLPIDYTVTLEEDDQIGSILVALELIDEYSSAGSFDVSIYKGNEGRRFTVKEDSYTFTPSPAPDTIYTNITDIMGNTMQYVDCTTASVAVSMPSDTSTHTDTITMTTALITLADELDYEVVTDYYLLVSIVDSVLGLTGYRAVKVIITDVNDNCPLLSPTEVLLQPEPVLQAGPLATFTTTDADSGENANIRYIVSNITEDPPVTWDDTYDLWGDVYLNYTTLHFIIVAMDNGTIPLGNSATASITVSNTCVLDVLFGKIQYMMSVDETTGELTFRVPKYWMYDFLCDEMVGLSTGTVLDNMMSASSTNHSLFTAAGRARLNQLENDFSGLTGGWVAGIIDESQFIEVDMGMPYRFTAVQIQGRSDADEWVTSFRLRYLEDGIWFNYTNATGHEIFEGNEDRSTVVKHVLNPVILSQNIRVNPFTWSGPNISMRLEFNGCSQAEQIFYNVSCMRCETTYYCEGDGVQQLCGRCHGNTTSCDRNPIEHSFGLASECSSCPEGWICEDGYATPCPMYHYVECTNVSCPLTCTPCETGYACFGGVRSICPPGSYSDGLQEHCVPCEPGTYQEEEGKSSCISCPVGYYSSQRGSRCDRCEPEEYSNSSGCSYCDDAAQCPCLTGDKCYQMSYCYNTGNGGYGCTECAAGLTGDGHTCTDINECDVHDPCFMSRCINTEPGYQCLGCPDGYIGTYEDAYSYNVHLRVFEYLNLERASFTYQTCEDVNECDHNNGGCDPLMQCVNTIGSYYCSFCASGYMGTNKSGCYLDNFCLSGAHNCIPESDCVYLGPAQYRCVCKPGYAGPGDVCGLDSDNDGFPDIGLPCTHWGCSKDNCMEISNSMQEDADGDNAGDNCDTDDDTDGIYDYKDNCQFDGNWGQADTDGDGVGDACDVCPGVSDPAQTDTDADGVGDACIDDDDNDGILDVSDNCPLVANPDQGDMDGDAVGDMCDNCPTMANIDQADGNENQYGDVCEPVGAINIDQDGDSILDSVDNCPSYMNADQSDIDADGTGDLCDDDIDDDGVTNDNDNCLYVANADQTDADGNNVGDVCETDSDGDGVADKNDTCPFNPAISSTSFRSYFTVNFDPALTTSAPKWLVKNNGGEVMQTTQTAMPTMLIGTQPYGAVEFQGTWFTTQSDADKYFGFVFGYHSNRKFYIVMWKGAHYNYKDGDDSTYQGGIQGVQIKLIDSSVGPGTQLAEALWHSYDTAGISTLLWQDPAMQGWEPMKSYRWFLTHRPSTGHINLRVYRGTELVVDSGDVYNGDITGGRLGVFQFGEFPVIWSDLRINCLEHTNQGLYFDGVDDYVQLDDAVTLCLENSFTIEVWLSLDSGHTSGPYPIFCTDDHAVCLSIADGLVIGEYVGVAVSSNTMLSPDQWYNLVFRHRIEDGELSLFIDGVLDATTTDVSVVNLTETSQTSNLTVYLGRDADHFFRGTVDELRIYSEGIPDNEIASHISLVSVTRPVLKAYNTLYFRMEDSIDATTLTNSGSLSAHTAIRAGPSFVTSYQQYQQFNIAFPDNR